MASYNVYRNKRAAHREAGSDLRWRLFPHMRTGSGSLPLPETGNADDLEGQQLPPHSTAPQAPTTSCGSVAQDAAAARPETGESSAELRQDPAATEAEMGPATPTHPVLRQRTAGAEEVTADFRSRKQERLFNPAIPLEPFTVRNQLSRVFFGSWMKILLLCCPAGFALNYAKGQTVETFAVNFAASIPLSLMSEIALAEIAKRLGKTLEQLLYLFTSNLTLLISCILLMTSGQSSSVQSTLAGSILANMLFVLGLSIVLGCSLREQQYFNAFAAHVSSNMLSLSATSLLIPTASRLLNQTSPTGLAKQSRGAAVILILVYALFLYCQLKTHRDFFSEESEKVEAKSLFTAPVPVPLRRGAVARGAVAPGGIMASFGLPRERKGQENIHETILRVPDNDDDDDDDQPPPQLHFAVAALLFLTTTTLLYFTIDFVVNSIDALTTSAGISRTFVALILLPLPNCDLAPVTHALKDNMDVTVTYTVGKCLQTALLVTPLCVLISWGLGTEDVTLAFDGFAVVSLFAAVLLLNFLIAESKVSWIQGCLLLADWSLVALAAFFAD